MLATSWVTCPAGLQGNHRLLIHLSKFSQQDEAGKSFLSYAALSKRDYNLVLACLVIKCFHCTRKPSILLRPEHSYGSTNCMHRLHCCGNINPTSIFLVKFLRSESCGKACRELVPTAARLKQRFLNYHYYCCQGQHAHTKSCHCQGNTNPYSE